MAIPKVRRAVMAVTLAGGLVAGGVGMGHALAASKASPSNSGSSSSRSSSTHHCPNERNNSSAATAAFSF
jgi:hypothetical protein